MPTVIQPTSEPNITMVVATKEGEVTPHRIRFLHKTHGWLVQVKLVAVSKEVMSVDLLLRNLDRLQVSEQVRAELDALQRRVLAGVVKQLRIDEALVQPRYETIEEEYYGDSSKPAGESDEQPD